MQDLSQDRSSAIETLQSSVKYGDTRFVLDPDNERGYDFSIQEACCNIDRAESPDLRTIGGYNSTSRTKAGLRRRRTSVDNTAITSDASGMDAGEDLEDGSERKRQRMTEKRD